MVDNLNINRKLDSVFARIAATGTPVSTVTIHPYDLQLTQPWVSNRSRLTQRSGFIIEVTDADGIVGFGDCAPMPEIGTESLHQANTAMSVLAKKLVGKNTRQLLLHSPTKKTVPALSCALEMALLDIAAKRLASPLFQVLSPAAFPNVPVNAVAGCADSQLADRISVAVRKGFQIFKVKTGIREPGAESEILRAASAALPPDALLRIDANGAWNQNEAIAFVKATSDLAIDHLEEPLARPKIDALRALQSESNFPLALDESLAHMQPGAIFNARAVSRLVLKPAARGGLLACLDIAERAIAAGLDCIVTSALESPVGLRACCHLAAAMPGELAHGLATADLFDNDDDAWPRIANGRIRIEEQPGLGIEPALDHLFV